MLQNNALERCCSSVLKASHLHGKLPFPHLMPRPQLRLCDYCSWVPCLRCSSECTRWLPAGCWGCHRARHAKRALCISRDTQSVTTATAAGRWLTATKSANGLSSAATGSQTCMGEIAQGRPPDLHCDTCCRAVCSCGSRRGTKWLPAGCLEKGPSAGRSARISSDSQTAVTVAAAGRPAHAAAGRPPDAAAAGQCTGQCCGQRGSAGGGGPGQGAHGGRLQNAAGGQAV